MATHTLVYYGHVDKSLHRLIPGQDRCWKKDGTEAAIDFPPSDFDGIKFGFMEKSGKDLRCYFFVQVDDILLRAPVLFVGGRHGPAAPGPQWSRLDDDVAMQILADAIVANPELRDMLANKLRRLGSGK